MEIENVRFLLSALIQSLATVMVIGFIALLSFPRRSSGNLPNTAFYELAKNTVIKLGFAFIIAIFLNIFLLAFLDLFDDLIVVIIIAIVTSFVTFLLLIMFLSDYVEKLKKI